MLRLRLGTLLGGMIWTTSFQERGSCKEIRKIVNKIAVEWGVDIIQVELQDIELPEDMKRVMARQAEAEREKRGVIIKNQRAK